MKKRYIKKSHIIRGVLGVLLGASCYVAFKSKLFADVAPAPAPAATPATTAATAAPGAAPTAAATTTTATAPATTTAAPATEHHEEHHEGEAGATAEEAQQVSHLQQLKEDIKKHNIFSKKNSPISFKGAAVGTMRQDITTELQNKNNSITFVKLFEIWKKVAFLMGKKAAVFSVMPTGIMEDVFQKLTIIDASITDGPQGYDNSFIFTGITHLKGKPVSISLLYAPQMPAWSGGSSSQGGISLTLAIPPNTPLADYFPELKVMGKAAFSEMRFILTDFDYFDETTYASIDVGLNIIGGIDPANLNFPGIDKVKSLVQYDGGPITGVVTIKRNPEWKSPSEKDEESKQKAAENAQKTADELQAEKDAEAEEAANFKRANCKSPKPPKPITARFILVMNPSSMKVKSFKLSELSDLLKIPAPANIKKELANITIKNPDIQLDLTPGYQNCSLTSTIEFLGSKNVIATYKIFKGQQSQRFKTKAQLGKDVKQDQAEAAMEKEEAAAKAEGRDVKMPYTCPYDPDEASDTGMNLVNTLTLSMPSSWNMASALPEFKKIFGSIALKNPIFTVVSQPYFDPMLGEDFQRGVGLQASVDISKLSNNPVFNALKKIVGNDATLKGVLADPVLASQFEVTLGEHRTKPFVLSLGALVPKQFKSVASKLNQASFIVEQFKMVMGGPLVRKSAKLNGTVRLGSVKIPLEVQEVYVRVSARETKAAARAKAEAEASERGYSEVGQKMGWRTNIIAYLPMGVKDVDPSLSAIEALGLTSLQMAFIEAPFYDPTKQVFYQEGYNIGGIFKLDAFSFLRKAKIFKNTPALNLNGVISSGTGVNRKIELSATLPDTGFHFDKKTKMTNLSFMVSIYGMQLPTFGFEGTVVTIVPKQFRPKKQPAPTDGGTDAQTGGDQTGGEAPAEESPADTSAEDTGGGDVSTSMDADTAQADVSSDTGDTGGGDVGGDGGETPEPVEDTSASDTSAAAETPTPTPAPATPTTAAATKTPAVTPAPAPTTGKGSAVTTTTPAPAPATTTTAAATKPSATTTPAAPAAVSAPATSQEGEESTDETPIEEEPTTPATTTTTAATKPTTTPTVPAAAPAPATSQEGEEATGETSTAQAAEAPTPESAQGAGEAGEETGEITEGEAQPEEAPPAEEEPTGDIPYKDEDLSGFAPPVDDPSKELTFTGSLSFSGDSGILACSMDGVVDLYGLILKELGIEGQMSFIDELPSGFGFRGLLQIGEGNPPKVIEFAAKVSAGATTTDYMWLGSYKGGLYFPDILELANKVFRRGMDLAKKGVDISQKTFKEVAPKEAVEVEQKAEKALTQNKKATGDIVKGARTLDQLKQDFLKAMRKMPKLGIDELSMAFVPIPTTIANKFYEQGTSIDAKLVIFGVRAEGAFHISYMGMDGKGTLTKIALPDKDPQFIISSFDGKSGASFKFNIGGEGMSKITNELSIDGDLEIKPLGLKNATKLSLNATGADFQMINKPLYGLYEIDLEGRLPITDILSTRLKGTFRSDGLKKITGDLQKEAKAVVEQLKKDMEKARADLIHSYDEKIAKQREVVKREREGAANKVKGAEKSAQRDINKEIEKTKKTISDLQHRVHDKKADCKKHPINCIKDGTEITGYEIKIGSEKAYLEAMLKPGKVVTRETMNAAGKVVTETPVDLDPRVSHLIAGKDTALEGIKIGELSGDMINKLAKDLTAAGNLDKIVMIQEMSLDVRLSDLLNFESPRFTIRGKFLNKPMHLNNVQLDLKKPALVVAHFFQQAGKKMAIKKK